MLPFYGSQCIFTCCVKMLPPKYEDVLEMSGDRESSAAADLVLPPPYNTVRDVDADKSTADN